MFLIDFKDSILSICNHSHFKVRPLIPNSFPLMEYLTVENKYPKRVTIKRTKQSSMELGIHFPSIILHIKHNKEAIIIS